MTNSNNTVKKLSRWIRKKLKKTQENQSTQTRPQSIYTEYSLDWYRERLEELTTLSARREIEMTRLADELAESETERGYLEQTLYETDREYSAKLLTRELAECEKITSILKANENKCSSRLSKSQIEAANLMAKKDTELQTLTGKLNRSEIKRRQLEHKLIKIEKAHKSVCDSLSYKCAECKEMLLMLNENREDYSLKLAETQMQSKNVEAEMSKELKRLTDELETCKEKRDGLQTSLTKSQRLLCTMIKYHEDVGKYGMKQQANQVGQEWLTSCMRSVLDVNVRERQRLESTLSACENERSTQVADLREELAVSESNRARLGARLAEADARVRDVLTFVERAVTGVEDELTGFGDKIDGLEDSARRLLQTQRSVASRMHEDFAVTIRRGETTADERRVLTSCVSYVLGETTRECRRLASALATCEQERSTQAADLREELAVSESNRARLGARLTEADAGVRDVLTFAERAVTGVEDELTGFRDRIDGLEESARRLLQTQWTAATRLHEDFAVTIRRGETTADEPRVLTSCVSYVLDETARECRRLASALSASEGRRSVQAADLGDKLATAEEERRRAEHARSACEKERAGLADALAERGAELDAVDALLEDGKWAASCVAYASKTLAQQLRDAVTDGRGGDKRLASLAEHLSLALDRTASTELMLFGDGDDGGMTALSEELRGAGRPANSTDLVTSTRSLFRRAYRQIRPKLLREHAAKAEAEAAAAAEDFVSSSAAARTTVGP